MNSITAAVINFIILSLHCFRFQACRKIAFSEAWVCANATHAFAACNGAFLRRSKELSLNNNLTSPQIYQQ
jgi:hypothetical protein